MSTNYGKVFTHTDHRIAFYTTHMHEVDIEFGLDEICDDNSHIIGLHRLVRLIGAA